VRQVALLLAIVMAGAAAPAVAKPKGKTVRIFDNYYFKDELTVKRGTTVTWRWPAEAGDVHDVKLKKGPKGVKKFHSQPASAEFSFKRKLGKPGRYRIVCTLHEEMKMTITVRR
jgi:plastocyanin